MRRSHSKSEMARAAAAGFERLKLRVAQKAEEARTRNARLLGDIAALQSQNLALRKAPASKDALQEARVSPFCILYLAAFQRLESVIVVGETSP